MKIILFIAIIYIIYRVIKNSKSNNKSASNSTNLSEDLKKYKQLICFIKFVKKVKPLMGGCYDMYISYTAPNRAQSEYSSRINASLGFYDFDEIRFAREYATKPSSVSAMMIKNYYNQISERANLEQSDWPYSIDVYDFADFLRGSYCQDYFCLIPDDYNDDIFTFKVYGGIDSRSGVQVSKAVINVLKHSFPELEIKPGFASSTSMSIAVKI